MRTRPTSVIRRRTIKAEGRTRIDAMDLDSPLGKTPPPKPPRLGLLLGVGGAIAAVIVLGGVGVFLATADPHGGEPYAVAQIPPPLPKPLPRPAPAPPSLDAAATGSIPTPAANRATLVDLNAKQAPPAPATSSAPSGPLIIDVAKALADRQQMIGATPPVPVPASAAAGESIAPRVAIFVSGMGLGRVATRTATELMPPAVTFAFVPYGEAIGSAVAAAKAKGHEILLQMPMQNTGGAAPGPHALRAGETPSEVASDAAWLMSRFDGYDGVVNLLGAPVTADRPAMGALLKAVAARGLFYLDDGTSRRSLGPGLALEEGMPAARADIVLDATADPAVVHANLEALVAIARRKGSAIGMASGLPDHLNAIATFASGLGARNVKLVPVGALVARGASVAVAR